MSHISRLQTRLVEKEFILKSLADLGYSYEEGDLTIHGAGTKEISVQIRVNPQKLGYEIGLLKKGATFEIVADWWGVIGTDKKTFANQLAQRYAYHTARAKLEAQGFDLVHEETYSDGRIQLVLRRGR